MSDARWPSIDRRWEAKANRDWSQSQASDPQTVIPTPDMPEAPNGPQASILAPQHAQERMYAFPDVMRGQQCLSTDQETNR